MFCLLRCTEKSNISAIFVKRTETVRTDRYTVGNRNRQERKVIKLDEILITMERHEQQLKGIERDLSDLREVQSEIRTMNETLVTLANELKHTNEHLDKNERKIDEIDHLPRMRLQQIVTALLSACAGAIMAALAGSWLHG